MFKSVLKWVVIVTVLFVVISCAMVFGMEMYPKLLVYSKSANTTADTIDFINRPGNTLTIYKLSLGLLFVLIINAINQKFQTKRVSRTMKILIPSTILIAIGSLFSVAYSYINVTSEGIYVRNPIMIERYYSFKDIKEIEIDFDRSKKWKPKKTNAYFRYKYKYDYSIKLSMWNRVNLSKGTKDYDLSKNEFNSSFKSLIKQSELPSIDKIHRILVDQYKTPVKIEDREYYDEIIDGEIFITIDQDKALRDIVDNNQNNN